MAQNVERIPEHQTFLEDDLHKAQFKLKQTELKLEEIAAQQSRYSFTKKSIIMIIIFGHSHQYWFKFATLI